MNIIPQELLLACKNFYEGSVTREGDIFCVSYDTGKINLSKELDSDGHEIYRTKRRITLDIDQTDVPEGSTRVMDVELILRSHIVENDKLIDLE